MLLFTGCRNALRALADQSGILFSISVAGTRRSTVARVKTICTANSLSQIVPDSDMLVFASYLFQWAWIAVRCMLVAWCLPSPSASLQSSLPSKESCQGTFGAHAESFATVSALSLALAGSRAAVSPSPSPPGTVGSSHRQSPDGKCSLWLRGNRGPGDGDQQIAALSLNCKPWAA